MTRVRHALLTLVGGACLGIGCGTTPRDVNFNTDAGSGFEPPPFVPEASADTTNTSGAAAAGGATGAGGAAGGTVDAGPDASSDGGTG
jgi:hypothetical protein